MITYNLTDEQKKILTKYNVYLMAVVGEEGLYGHAYASAEEGIYDAVSFQPKGTYGYQRRDELDINGEGYNLLCDIADSILSDRRDEISDYLYCDDCTEYGSVDITYDPVQSKFIIDLEIGVRVSNEYSREFTFDQLKNESQGQWGQRYNELKKLGDPEFIEKMKKDYGNTLEMTYDGGGDSGQINDYGSTDTGSSHIKNDIESIGYEVIDIYYSGWENNEGADGNIFFDFENQTVSLNHIDYGEDSVTESLGEFILK